MVALAVLKKLKKAANHAGVNYSETELTNHTGITVRGTRPQLDDTQRSTTSLSASSMTSTPTN
jgi:hypothetical protein